MRPHGIYGAVQREYIYIFYQRVKDVEEVLKNKTWAGL